MNLKFTPIPLIAHLLAFFSIAILAYIAYMPIDLHQFLHWDDYTYVYKNPYMDTLNSQSLKWALSTTYFAYWQPITWISHLTDYTLWGMDAGMHHITNLIFHIIVSFLVFLLTKRLLDFSWSTNLSTKIVIAWLSAILFTIHPQHVEVVAWISERKELLSTIFYIATILIYLQYNLSKLNHNTNTRALFALSFLLFLMAIMSKPIAITLPALLLMLDIYPLNRFSNRSWHLILFEKIPFFIVSLIVIGMTLYTQSRVGAMESTLHFNNTLINTFKNTLFYPYKLLWPIDLVPLYPFPDFVINISLLSFLPIIIFLIISATLLFLAIYKKQYYWLFIWLGYLIVLAPVSGIIQSGPQSAADRYAYLTTIGFYILISLGLHKLWCKTLYYKIIYLLSITTIIFTLTYLTQQQVHVWKNDFSLWSKVIQHYPQKSDHAYNSLGSYYFEHGQFDLALENYLTAIRINPKNRQYYDNIMAIYHNTKQWHDALLIFQRLTHNQQAITYVKLGEIYEHLAQPKIAMQTYQKALLINPQLPAAHFNIAKILFQKQQIDAATIHLMDAIQYAPDFVDAMLLLASIREQQNQSQQALHLYLTAWKTSPEYTPTHIYLGNWFFNHQQYPQAKASYQRAIRLEPNNAKAQHNLELTLKQLQDNHSNAKK